MPSKRRFLLPLVALVLAGCGGANAVPSAQRKLIAEADPICASASAKRATANARLGNATSLTSPRTLKVLTETAPGVAAYESEAVAKLRALSAPASLANDWQTLLTGLQELARDTARLGVYAKDENTVAAEKLISESRVTREHLLAIASRDGFANCGRAD